MRNRSEPSTRVVRRLAALHVVSLLVGIAALALLAHVAAHHLVSSAAAATIAMVLIVALVAFSAGRLQALRRGRRQARPASADHARTLEG